MTPIRYTFILLFFFSWLITINLRSQAFADKSFYLLDSLVLEDLSTNDRKLIDSCLMIYHKTDREENKILALIHICENMEHNYWSKYQYLLKEIIEESIDKYPIKEAPQYLRKALGDAYNNLGLIHMKQRNLIKAISYFKKSIERSTDMNNDKGVAVASYNLGNTYSYVGKTSKALLFHFRALQVNYKLMKEVGDIYIYEIASSLKKIGDIYRYRLDIYRAIFYYNKSLELYTKINDMEGSARVMNNIASLYLEQNEDQKALEYYQRSLNLHEETNSKVGIAASLTNIGSVYNHLNGNVLKAEKYYYQSLEIYDSIRDMKGSASTTLNLGTVYLTKGDTSKSLDYYHKTLTISEDFGYEKMTATTLNGIGLIYLKRNNLTKSLSFVGQSLEISRRLKSIPLMKNAAESLSKVYEKLGQFEKSLHMHQLYVQMKDSLDQKRVLANLTKRAHDLEIEKRDQKITILEKEKELKSARLQISYITYSIILVLIVTLFIAWFQIKKRKYERELQTLRQLKAETDLKKSEEKMTSIAVTSKKKMLLVELTDVMCFSGYGNYTFLNTRLGKSYVIDHTLSFLEKSLPSYFMRVHRSSIINTKTVKEINKTYKGKVVFTLKEGELEKSIPSSQSYATDVKRLMDELGFN